MDAIKMSSALPELGVRATHGSPIIVATDAREQSDAALVVGRLFAGAPEALRVITVLKPLPIVSAEAQITVSTELVAAQRAEARQKVIDQMHRTWDDAYDVELADGDPASRIARLAHDANATMIVCGLGRHRVSDRVFGDETALRLIRMADVPVFAAAHGLNHAPRRIVVAADFSETSLRAARLALDLAASNATMYLVHVAPRDSTLYEWNSSGTTYKQDAGEALQKTRNQLHIPRDIAVQHVMLQGDPATELLAFAGSVNADLIATGSHGHGFVRRLLIGSVATRIVRLSSCSVLTVPHAAAMTNVETVAGPPSMVQLSRALWPVQLDDFTRRNAGRRGTLEVDDPELDAQAQEFDYPFLGAVYDKHDHRVELMFGDDRPEGRHLTHGIGGVTSIELMRSETGRDLAIRIAHGPGLTLLTFAS